MNKDQKELNELLAASPPPDRSNRAKAIKGHTISNESPCDPEKAKELGGYVQWTSNDGKIFIPAGRTRPKVAPGVYEIHTSHNVGLYFEKITVRTEGLIRFPQTNSEKVLTEIEKFWDRQDRFEEYNLTYKRGIILYGPAGGGKTCCVNLLMNDVVKRGGAVIKFTNPNLFIDGIRVFREIQPDTPAVVLMEDIDSIIDSHEESKVLNILDGVERVNRIVFLATTNYPERLGARIVNRPSRFDKRFKIGYPDAESRMIYLKFLCGKKVAKSIGVDLEKWVGDTENFTIAHLQELFTAVVVQGDSYEEALECLQSMKEDFLSSQDDETKKMGFSPSKYCDDSPYKGGCDVPKRIK